MEMKHELDALYKIDKAIEKLDEESKKNVIHFLHDRFIKRESNSFTLSYPIPNNVISAPPLWTSSDGAWVKIDTSLT